MGSPSPYGTCPTHAMPNTKTGGCYMCHEDARRQMEVNSLRAEVSRLKAALGLPDGPTRTEVAAAYIGVEPHVIEAAIELDRLKKSPDSARGMSLVRQALTERRKLYFTYRDIATDNRSERVVQPRSLVFRGDHWSLLGWCEMREEYRSFRLDRMRDITVMQERCPPFDTPTGKPEETDQ